MLTPNRKSPGGENGSRPASDAPLSEIEKAQDIARRYRCEFVDLRNFQLHHDLFSKLPVHLMFRYNFVPLEETADGRLAIAIADPSQLMMIDEISLLLRKQVTAKVSTLSQITDILKKTEQSQARSGRSQRRLCARRRPRRRRLGRQQHLHRPAHRRRRQPHHPPGRHHHLYRPAAPGQ